MNSTWATGDWNGDGEFSTSDLVSAFEDGGYEKGPRVAVNAVPEPASTVLLMGGLIVITFCRRRNGCIANTRDCRGVTPSAEAV